LMNGAASPNASQSGSTKKLGIGNAVLVVLVMALNAAGVFYIISNHHASVKSIHEQYTAEVSSLAEELSKSRDSASVLRSGIDVFEQELQAKMGTKDFDDITDFYDVDAEQESNVGLQSSEEQQAWLEKLDRLEKERDSASNEFDAKMAEFDAVGEEEGVAEV